jgi:hypothetical protein
VWSVWVAACRRVAPFASGNREARQRPSPLAPLPSRSFRVHAPLAQPPIALPPGASRADQLRAAVKAGEEVGKQQRRQSKQGGATGRQGGGAGGGAQLPPIREGEEAAGAGRKRAPPGDELRSARKRSRGGSVDEEDGA